MPRNYDSSYSNPNTVRDKTFNSKMGEGFGGSRIPPGPWFEPPEYSDDYNNDPDNSSSMKEWDYD
jgi:hypothetical protein